MNFLPPNVTRTIGRQILKTKKNSPHIFFGLGIAGVLGGTALACRATLKAGNTLDEVQSDIQAVKDKASESAPDEGSYHRDLSVAYARGAVKMGKLYFPSAALIGVGVASLTGSHIQMTQRNTALSASLAAVSTAYERYREAVAQKIGAEDESDIYHGATIAYVADEDGTEMPVPASDGPYGPYAVLFDEFNPRWDRHPHYNETFLRAQETYWNQRLQTKGHVFLNEVLASLGFEHTSPGALVGWIYESEDGDSYIDFDLYAVHNENFMNGPEKSVWLDFNVDGVIYDKI